MKILMLTPYLPYPPESGGQIRTLNLLKYLSKQHDITLIALYKNNREKKHAQMLEPYCKEVYVCKRPEHPWQLGNILKAIFSWTPFLIVRNYSPEAAAVVSRLLAQEQFDVIHAETFYIMPHLPKTDIPILLVEQTIECNVYEHFLKSIPAPIRWGLYIDIFKLKFWERFYWRKATVVSSVSEQDRKEIQKIDSTINAVVIPNGAGDEMFIDVLPKKDLKIPTVLFVGNFSWLQNVEAAQYLISTIFPKLHRAMPELELIIAGQRATKIYDASLPDGVRIVPIHQDDTSRIRTLYSEATLFIAPIYGPGGTRLKILAAMASGLPVISSATGVEGLAVEPGVHVQIAHSPDEFVSHTGAILHDPNQYYAMQSAAFNLAKKIYSWESIAHDLESVYTRITTPRTS